MWKFVDFIFTFPAWFLGFVSEAYAQAFMRGEVHYRITRSKQIK